MVHDSAHRPLIMLVGMGNLSANVLNMLLVDPSTSRVVLAGRNPEDNLRRANLSRFAAHNLGLIAAPDVVKVDLCDVARTAETIARVKPDIIFMGASLQSWRVITQLPSEVFEALDEAQFGPWLPMHLTLNLRLMQAVQASGHACKVVNAAFPDAVGPVLAKVGLAPSIGIGNVANIIPALTYSVASILGEPAADITLRLVAQHYFSHYVPRFGSAGRSQYHLSVELRGQPLEQPLAHAEIFARLNGPLKRLGGVDGQLLTASSAMRVLRALSSDTPTFAHAPAPGGLPGGYPVRISRQDIAVDLDPAMSLPQAIAINEACQRADGIEHIADDGTVTFTEPEMAIMQKMLGYRCRQMKLADVAGWADELGARYRQYARAFRPLAA